jgi:hypothetical protein
MAAKRISFVTGLLFAGLFAPVIWAGEGGVYMAGNPWMFSTQVVIQSGPDLMPIRCAVTTVGTNKFAFAVPENYQVDVSSSQKVTVNTADFSVVFTLRICGPNPDDGAALDVDTYRATLLRDHPNAAILAEFGANAGGGHGPAFDIRWKVSGKVDRYARVEYVPSRLGVIEFSMTSSQKAAGQAKADLNFMMMTFRTNGDDGKLSLPAISNHL